MMSNRHLVPRIARIIAEAGYHVYRPDLPAGQEWSEPNWDMAGIAARTRWTRTARVLVQWAARVPAERITELRVAHALHAAWVVAVVRYYGKSRRYCHAWTDESQQQRAAYHEAARLLAPVLRAEREAVTQP